MRFSILLAAFFFATGCTVRVNTGNDGSTSVQTGSESDQAAVRAAATHVVALLDSERFDEVWSLASSSFKQSSSLGSFALGVRKSHADFGTPKSRTIVGYSFPDVVEGAPPGKYGVIFYGSDFSKVEGITEQVVFVREGDKWHLAGYWVEKGKNARVL